MRFLQNFIILVIFTSGYCQNSNNVYANTQALQKINYNYLTFLAADTNMKETAKELSQFRAKEFIINNIIGKAGNEEIQFETESLASDDSGGLVSVAFNCDHINKRGLLLAFVGYNRDQNGISTKAYGFRPIKLEDAKQLLARIEQVRTNHKKYLSNDTNVNNVYIEFEDMQFIIYRDGGSKIRVLWNGFEIVWEDTAFSRSKRRLDKWFEK